MRATMKGSRAWYLEFMLGQRLIDLRHDFDNIEENHSSSAHDILVEAIGRSHGNVGLHEISLKLQGDRFHASHMFPFVHR